MQATLNAPAPDRLTEKAQKYQLSAFQHENIFWKVKTDKEGGFQDITIDVLKLYKLLYELGIRRYDVSDQESIFIELLQNKIVRRVNITRLQDLIYNYIDQLPEKIVTANSIKIERDLITGKLLKSISTYFNEQKLFYLKPKEPIELQTDGAYTKFMYFENGFLEITATETHFKTYDQLTGYVWEHKIIKHQYNPTDTTATPIEQFFKNISKTADRFQDLKTITGYLTHGFFETKLKAVLLTDSTISEGNEADGRTGKTLYCRILGHALTNRPNEAQSIYIEINGKDFDPGEKHKYSRANIDTQLICINDLRRNTKADIFYNDIPEGIVVDKKGLQPFKIMQKLVLTTNQVIIIEGASSRDRITEFEFSDYYNEHNTPESEFQHWFFRDWNAQQWNAFYMFMADCSRNYLAAGKLPTPKEINLTARKLKDYTCSEFVDFMTDLKILPGEFYNKKDLFTRFVEQNGDYNNPRFKQQTFSKWLISYNNLAGPYSQYKKETNEDRKSTGERYFIFQLKK